MEKNGNTLAPGDKVTSILKGKVASKLGNGEVVDVDTQVNMVRVKWAHGTEWVDFSSIEKAT